jgi:hypothetical protein
LGLAGVGYVSKWIGVKFIFSIGDRLAEFLALGGLAQNIGHWPTKATIMRVELSRFIDRTWMISLKQGNIDFNKD